MRATAAATTTSIAARFFCRELMLISNLTDPMTATESIPRFRFCHAPLGTTVSRSLEYPSNGNSTVWHRAAPRTRSGRHSVSFC
jgi:hypothetical protein